jgi:hypothetical protein
MLSDRRTRENRTSGGMGREWVTDHECAREALQWGNPQQTDRRHLSSGTHSFTLVFAPCATARPALQALLPKQPPHKPDDRTTGGPSTSQPAAVAQLPAVESSVASSEDLPPPRYRRPWHELLKRVFDLDLVCGRCGARMHHISHIDDPQVIDKILGHLGLPTQMPPRAPARAPPQDRKRSILPTSTSPKWTTSRSFTSTELCRPHVRFAVRPVPGMPVLLTQFFQRNQCSGLRAVSRVFRSRPHCARATQPLYSATWAKTRFIRPTLRARDGRGAGRTPCAKARPYRDRCAATVATRLTLHSPLLPLQSPSICASLGLSCAAAPSATPWSVPAAMAACV